MQTTMQDLKEFEKSSGPRGSHRTLQVGDSVYLKYWLNEPGPGKFPHLLSPAHHLEDPPSICEGCKLFGSERDPLLECDRCLGSQHVSCAGLAAPPEVGGSLRMVWTSVLAFDTAAPAQQMVLVKVHMPQPCTA